MYGHYFPEARVDGVEIDGELTEIGARYFDLGGPNLHTYTADARPWLRQSDGDYDVIVVDAYRQPYIPFYLATTRVLREVRGQAGARRRRRRQRRPSRGQRRPRAGDRRRRWPSEFPTVMRDPVEDANTLLLGTDAPEASRERLLAADRRSPGRPPQPRGRRLGARSGRRLPGGDVYTDDRAPVEWLIDKSILGYAERVAAGAGGARPRIRGAGIPMIVDCAQYLDGVRQDTGPLDIETAAERAGRSGGFVWLGLHAPDDG